MRLQTWERYVPDVEDNRARAQRGEPALVVPIRPPTARVWSRFWLAVAEHPRRADLPPHLEAVAALMEQGDGAGTSENGHQDLADAYRTLVRLNLATLDEDLAGVLWHGCVGDGIEWPTPLWPGEDAPPTTAAGLWALRDRLDSHRLYSDILQALINRAQLTQGLARFLASASGPPASPPPAASPAGTVANAAPVA